MLQVSLCPTGPLKTERDMFNEGKKAIINGDWTGKLFISCVLNLPQVCFVDKNNDEIDSEQVLT